MNKLPAFQFYPADWKKDMKVQSLSFEERGIWFEILCLMHESEQRGKLIINNVPIDEKTIARLIGCDVKIFKKAFAKIMSLGVAYKDEKGVIYNKRMVNDEHIIKVRREAGSMGGNPILLNQVDKQKRKQKLTPSFASSSSFTKEAAGEPPEEIKLETVIEYLTGATSPIVSSLQIKKEAIKLIEKYKGAKIFNLRSVCNTWADGIKPENKQMVI